MKRPQFTQSIRFGVAVAIVLMGTFGLGVALLTGERYKWLMNENDQRALTELLGYEVQADMREHYQRQETLAHSLTKRSDFRDAARAGDTAALRAVLDDQFRQFLVSSGKLALAQLQVLRPDFRPLAASTATPPPYQGRPACQEVVDRAADRQGLERLKLLRALCEHDREIRAATIVPVGGIRPFAYLMIVANPAPNLLDISQELHNPLEVLLPDGTAISRSGDWRDPAKVEKWLPAEYVARTPSGRTAFAVRVYRDGAFLAERLARTRLTLTASTLALIGLAMLLAFLVLNRILIKPLRELTSHVRRVTRDRSLLGEPVHLRGGGEIRELAASFNDMSEELSRLYRELESMAFSDPLTRLPNRAWFYDSLHRLASLTDRGAPGFALLFLDLDRFKAVNDTLGHQVGDEVLKLLSARIIGVLRGGDYLARLGDEASDALARMGGDEFAILLPSVSEASSAERVAQKVIAAIERPMQIGDHHLDLGTSIGIALYPSDAGDVETLVHHADLAMYHAKGHGRGYTRFTPELLSATTQP